MNTNNAILRTIEHNSERSLGRRGGTRITTTAAVTGNFGAIKALKDTTISAATSNITNLAGAVLLAGDVLPGVFTSIAIASGGDLVAYNA
ncbi:hypothetical protein NDA01_28030 [Trichocoleus desertorum AS-A10]|uniref:hypothetical protein n=1 Tax=Trichocoleus desertorum TaxID=1481672 RepID=UPI003298C3C1